MGHPLQITRVALGLTVSVPEDLVELNMGYLPWVLGDSLAAQVSAEVAERKLGYFPAVDYFRREAGRVDPDLISLIDEVGQFCIDFTRRELRRRLSRVFSNVQIEQAQCLAYTLPRVRPSQPHAVTELGRHFSPDKVRLNLVLSTIQKVTTEEPVSLTVRKVTHWGREPFACFEVNGTRLLGT
ncbi:MAG: hypothetical protein AB7U81_11435 [Thiohalomonadaceae bacterium]